jgi:branched-chain amino acid transport system ATP-binding protein
LAQITARRVAAFYPLVFGLASAAVDGIGRPPERGAAVGSDHAAGLLVTQQSVENNLLLGATPLNDRSRKAELLERVYEIFPRLKERRGQRAGTMSGGERQMLAVGRALMSDPKLLMPDEPSLGLAPAVVESIYETFGRLRREGLTILLAEQSIELALEVSDFATVLQVGRSVLSGAAAALANDPQVQKAYLGGS